MPQFKVGQTVKLKGRIRTEWKVTKPTFRDIHGSGFVEATCAHGIGHHRGIHGCDGCCFEWPKEISEQTTNEKSDKLADSMDAIGEYLDEQNEKQNYERMA